MNSRAARQHDILITFVLTEIEYEFDIIYHLSSLLIAFSIYSSSSHSV
jgi:hypothetical protein